VRRPHLTFVRCFERKQAFRPECCEVRLRGNIDATSATNLSSKLAAEADIGCRVSKPVASHGGAFNRTDADSARIGECRLGALTYRGRRHADAVTPLPNWCRKLPGRLCRTPRVALSSADSAKGRHRVKHQKWQPLRRNLGGEGQLKRLTARGPLHDHAAYFFPGGSSPHLFWITAVGVSGFAAGAGALAAGSGGASGVAMAMPNSRHCPPAT